MKIFLRRVLWVLLVVCALLLSSLVVYVLAHRISLSPAGLTPIVTNQKHVRVGVPIRLEIPRLHIGVPIEQAGLTPQGAMGVPEGPMDVAWFKLGPRPGEIGNAVIAGHEGWKNGIPAVFDILYMLQPGDNIVIEDEYGAIMTFVVRKVKTLDQYADAATIFNSSDGKAHLNLITCEGVWNPAQKSYANRLVVFADKIVQK